MPSAETILNGLSEIANEYTSLAIMWHFAFLVFVIFLFTGWRPSKKIAGIILSFPLITVSALAFGSGNPFNGTTFAVFAVLLIIFGIRMPDERINIKLNFNSVLGVLVIIFGWVYPHFLNDAEFFKYFYASPMGLVPCPTLSTVIGFTLLFNHFGKKTWPVILSIAGLFYGIFGMFRLGVTLDIGLLIGALGLLGVTLFDKK